MIDTARSAVLSPCERFRYRLARQWGEGRPVLFVMLNPSTADASVDDPTIRRCSRFAHAFGMPGLEVVNLFAYRATDPHDLKRAGYPVGPENDRHIEAAAASAGRVVLAWGAGARGLARPSEVLALLRRAGVQPLCLGTTARGEPRHPLYLPSACELAPYTEATR